MPGTVEELTKASDRVWRVWLVSIGFVFIAGAFFNADRGQREDIDTLGTRMSAEESRTNLLQAEVMNNREFADFVQQQNEEDHTEILEAIRELDR